MNGLCFKRVFHDGYIVKVTHGVPDGYQETIWSHTSLDQTVAGLYQDTSWIRIVNRTSRLELVSYYSLYYLDLEWASWLK